MKPSELKYITPEIIEKGGINVTSPEMLDEARRYNMDAVVNGAKRNRVKTTIGIWLIAQYIILFFNMAGFLTLDTLGAYGDYLTYARLAGYFIGLLAYLILYTYNIIIKGVREPKYMFLCSAPLLVTTCTGILIVIVNTLLGILHEKTDEKLSQEAGFPAFARLNITTVESTAKSIQDLTYDSIKERAKKIRHDEGDFLQ
ncbi:MAG: hypothetical protein K5979_14565 [Ruminococcus sp.]|nr:hypothetical protein [Ruminococcus sp.]